MYKIFLTKQVAKECKKRGVGFKKEVVKILQTLQNDSSPTQSEKLSGNLSSCRSYHFNFAGTAYRLAYQIDEEAKIITAIMIGPRENFYKILKQKFS
ncbi:type II toxin-antitoxin system RelE/ParE family toxin [Candidatus Microgenomates bacterium]|nr:type II toxin-antitoxin system RelE/ParE family toxin [Candidatus Microgenomates bacterium]